MPCLSAVDIVLNTFRTLRKLGAALMCILPAHATDVNIQTVLLVVLFSMLRKWAVIDSYLMSTLEVQLKEYGENDVNVTTVRSYSKYK